MNIKQSNMQIMRNFHRQLTLQIAIVCAMGMVAIAQSESDPPNLPPPLESPSLEDTGVAIPAKPQEPVPPEAKPAPDMPEPKDAPAIPQLQPVAPIAPTAPAPTAPKEQEAATHPSTATPSFAKPNKAEVAPDESFDAVAGERSSIESTSKRLLNEDTPEWVKKGLLLGDEHSVAISSSLFPTLEQCQEDLKARMMSEVYSYLDQHVLDHSRSQMLPELTRDYVEKFWVNQKQVFDNVHEREGVTYHQLWIGLHISAEQLKKVREWEKTSVRTQRTKSAGVMSGIGIGAITLLSGLVGVMARREKAKLRA